MLAVKVWQHNLLREKFPNKCMFVQRCGLVIFSSMRWVVDGGRVKTALGVMCSSRMTVAVFPWWWSWASWGGGPTWGTITSLSCGATQTFLPNCFISVIDTHTHTHSSIDPHFCCILCFTVWKPCWSYCFFWCMERATKSLWWLVPSAQPVVSISVTAWNCVLAL